MVLTRAWETLLLLGVPILIDEGPCFLSELGRPIKLESRFVVFIQFVFRGVVSASWVLESSDAEAVVCLFKCI